MRVSTNAPPPSSNSSSNFEFQQMAAALEDKMTLTFRNEMNEMKNMMKALVPTPAPIKAVEERCTTCGNNHSFNVCPMTRGGYEYPVYHDNFQQFQQTASVGNFVQNGNSGFRGEEIDKEYERDCEIRIRKLKQDFNIWGSEVRKKEKAYEDEKYAAACRYMLSVTCDDDDDEILGFLWRFQFPNTIHIPVSQNVEPKDSLIMGDGHINTTPETETNSVETLVSNPICSDNSITRGIESDRDSGEDTTSIDDLPLDDSMILPEYETFTFDDEPVMAEVNVFDEINTSELSYPGIGENVVSDERKILSKFTNPTIFITICHPIRESSKELAPSKALLTLNVFDPLHPPLMDFNVTKAFSGFFLPDLGSFIGSILWKDKAIPQAISIDGLQSSLHK
ncbi:hypothetical protein Tco_0496845 [Tanacetum coccineum]